MVAIFKSAWMLFMQGLSVEIMYRLALLQTVVASAIGFIGLIMFWLAAGKAAGVASEYSPAMILAYFVIASSHYILHEDGLHSGLSADIRMGKLSAFMLRPVPYLIVPLMKAASFFVVRVAILVPIVFLLFSNIDLLADVTSKISGSQITSYLFAMLLAMAAGWAVKIALGLLAFDMTQTWGPELIFMSFYYVMSGTNYPPDIVPIWLHELISWTPFYYMIGFPTLVLLGRVSDAVFWAELTRGGIVFVITIVVVVLMWRRGIKKFEAIGI